jgi:chloramphenicol O-acetyltransferase type A
MKKIDLENWNRIKHFNFYKNYTFPHFSVTANLNVTSLVKYAKEHKISFFPSFLYIIMKSLNAVENFKYRIRGEEVVLHDFVTPSFTVLNEEELYVFCTTEYNPDYETYINKIKHDIEKSKKGDRLEDIPGKDDLVFISSLP